MKIHEAVAENRLGFAQKLSEMSEELAALAKEVDRTRKAVSRRPPSLFHFNLTQKSRQKTWLPSMSELSRGRGSNGEGKE